MFRQILWRVVLAACFLAGVVIAGCGADRSSVRPRAQRQTAASMSVVMVNVAGVRRDAAGTGWVYSAHDGLVMTAFHVTNGASQVQVKVGRSRWRRATVVAAAPCDDVALLSLADRRGLRTMPLGTHSALSRGAPVVGVGFTGDGGPRTWESSFGVVSHTRVKIGPAVRRIGMPALDDLLETTAITSPGLSGGPVLDKDRELVAMTVATWTSRGGTKRGLSIRLDRLLEMLDAFHRGEAPGLVGSGLFFFRAPDRSRRGVVVTGLPGEIDGGYPNGGVLVTAVDGVSVGSTFTSWCRTVGALPAGWAKLTIVRHPTAAPQTITIPVNRSHVRE